MIIIIIILLVISSLFVSTMQSVNHISFFLLLDDGKDKSDNKHKNSRIKI